LSGLFDGENLVCFVSEPGKSNESEYVCELQQDLRNSGAGIALMVWGCTGPDSQMLVGAELNAELAKRNKEGAIEQKEDPPTSSMKLIA
jgi:uncharacterized protein YidB (DUF937 family)